MNNMWYRNIELQEPFDTEDDDNEKNDDRQAAHHPYQPGDDSLEEDGQAEDQHREAGHD